MRISHRPGIATPEASWDDLVQLVELRDDGSVRHGQAFVTAEFMRDAVDPLYFVIRELDERTS